MESATARLWNKVAKPVTRASLGPDKEEVGVLRERKRERFSDADVHRCS